MFYFLSPQTHLGLLPSGQGGAASPGSSLGLYSPAEPVVVDSGGPGPLSQKAKQVVPGAQAVPEARHCPGGASWETLPRKEHSRYCHKLCFMRWLETVGWEDGCSRSRAPHLGGPSRPGLSQEVLPVPSEARGKEASSQPDICILTLAMMIAGIPTVPVPGLREEDLIRAAQAFMLAHREPERAVEGPQWVRAQPTQPLGRLS
ncbi:spermatogenesis-associated protein 25 [Fukomys damarensis]|uniref:Spermatogenesis-associated protein 25 n=1 Tax=Fukomys damarensis TaxID=885580 RepID=A0A091DPK0_FUKDA|nr:spermatogenesis-associated protein 25 [Fukomys damarensis]KFO32403.1 hypothetical protein H920_06182 [Fukomys damarensis]